MNLNVSPLSGKVPDGFKSPVCQDQACGKKAAWLVRGTPSLAVCADHLNAAMSALSKEEA